MSKETIKKFYEALKSDRSMAEALKKEFDAAKPETDERAAELVVKLAAGKGYVFTVADLKALNAETKQLGTDDLEKINAAGGVECRSACRLLWW